MKKNELVLINFEHNNDFFSARVYKYAPTAIVLPDHTVLKTNCIVLTRGSRRDPEGITRTRQIFDGRGGLVPLCVLRTKGGWTAPLETRFPIVFATKE